MRLIPSAFKAAVRRCDPRKAAGYQTGLFPKFKEIT
jgi:hypothetical protein